jgi:hypothetical protein
MEPYAWPQSYGRSLHFHLRDGGACIKNSTSLHTHTRSSSGAIRVSSLAPQACSSQCFIPWWCIREPYAKAALALSAQMHMHSSIYIIISHKKAERRSAKPTGWEGAVRRIWICTLQCAQLHTYGEQCSCCILLIHTYVCYSCWVCLRVSAMPSIERQHMHP